MTDAANPFVRPGRWVPAAAPEVCTGDVLADATAALAGNARAERRRAAAARAAARDRDACQAWMLERRSETGAAPPAAWTQACDGACAVLGPVARWLREHGEGAPEPVAATSRDEFLSRLDVLVRLADGLAARSQALADGEGWSQTAEPSATVFAELDRLAGCCLRVAVGVRRAVSMLRLESDQGALLRRASVIVAAVVDAAEDAVRRSAVVVG